MKEYTVKYTLHKFGEVKEIGINAGNAFDAWQLAQWTAIPFIEGTHAYSAWVDRVTYSNGRVHYFNTHEGKAI